MSVPAADIFRRAAELNLSDERRSGAVIHLEEGMEVWLTGDLHGNRKALNRVIRTAALPRHGERRLVLQELIHGPPDATSGQDRSIELLLRAARLKCELPGQVIFLMGNHDLAQATGCEIAKGGREVCHAFIEGVRYAFGDHADEVYLAVCDFLRSLPLAARCPNGVWMCHSIPSPEQESLAGEQILLKSPFDAEDLARGSAVYHWTWGRGQTSEQIVRLAEALGAEFFLLGHRHSPRGFERIAPRAICLASDNEFGVLARFRSDEPADLDRIEDGLVRIASLPA
jgi:hypothetical protein